MANKKKLNLKQKFMLAPRRRLW